MKRIIAVFLALFALIAMFGCQKKDPEPNTETAPQKVNVYTLNGTTGFGMAKLMDDVKTGAITGQDYQFTVKSDASDVQSALTSGDADIAALPTNAAANLYQKTNGGIKILAINTLGCLYVMNTTGVPLESFSALDGKTVYTPAQNPAFIFTYLCRQNNINVTIDSKTYAQPALLKDAVASGAVEYAVLPEPMVTIAKKALATAGKSVQTLDLTEIWDQDPEVSGKLVQGCIVVRTAFLEAYPETVKSFLQSYKASVNYISDPQNLDNAGTMIASAGIFENANVAKLALPNCNVHYMDGTEMKSAMQAYLGILYQINPNAVGGALPNDQFYYIP